MVSFLVQLGLSFVVGCPLASARRGGKWCPIELPANPNERQRLIVAAIEGKPFEVKFTAEGVTPWLERVNNLELAVFNPNGDGLVVWIAIDLDSMHGHGPNGLGDTLRAVRCIASAADLLGLFPGCVFARSRSGRGWHIFLLLPRPVPLTESVLGLSALIATAYDLAASDVEDGDGEPARPHAFLNGYGKIAEPGASGAVELIPKSDSQPRLGWAIAMPRQAWCPFDNRPIELVVMPRCPAEAWDTLIREALATLPLEIPKQTVACRRSVSDVDPLGRLPQRVKDFLARGAAQGNRDSELFAAACSMFGYGMDGQQIESLIIEAAQRCDPPFDERTARAKVASARRTVRR